MTLVSHSFLIHFCSHPTIHQQHLHVHLFFTVISPYQVNCTSFCPPSFHLALNSATVPFSITALAFLTTLLTSCFPLYCSQVSSHSAQPSLFLCHSSFFSLQHLSISFIFFLDFSFFLFHLFSFVSFPPSFILSFPFCHFIYFIISTFHILLKFC